jgi:hypothetical protein
MTNKKTSKKKGKKVGQKSSAKAWDRARRVFPALKKKLLRRTGVIGVSLGLAYKNGKMTLQPAIRVHLAQKVHQNELKWNQKIPGTIGGVRVDVIESSFEPTSQLASASRLRILRNPMFGGVALTRVNKTNYGTLSALVADAAGNRFVLTAQHVVGATGGQIVQPALGTLIGQVHSTRLNSDMDAALVRLTTSRQINSGVSDSLQYTQSPLLVRPGTVDSLSLPFPVDVIGASSGKTIGFIDAVQTAMDVEYPGQTVSFVNQLHLVGDGSEISRGGDSGALVLERGTNKVIALLFAGESEGSDFGLATPIHRILDEFAVSFA